jgi:O-antigen/teichoic acid export membrane protein
MKLSTKIAYNSIIQLLSKGTATILGLVAIGIMARSLGPSGFGEFTTVMTFLSFFGIIADFGLTLVTVQMINKPGTDRAKTLSNLLALRLATASVFLALGPIAALFFPYSAAIKFGIAIGAANFLFIALNQILVGFFQKTLRMDKVSIAEVAGRIVMLAGVYVSWRLDLSLFGYILSSSLGGMVNFIALFFFARKAERIKLSFDKDVWKEVMLRAWPLSITIILNLLYLKTDTLLLSVIKTQTEVGIYGAAYKVVDVIVTIPFIFCGIVLPIISSRWLNKDKDGFRSALQKTFDAMAMIAIPMAAGTQLIANDLMVLVAGKDFSISGPALRILIIAAAAIFIGSASSHAIVAIEQQKKIIPAYVFTAITALAAYGFLIPKYSYFGAAWATVYSETAMAFFSIYYIWKSVRFMPNFQIVFKALAASLIMCLFLFLFGSLPVLIRLPAAIAVYGSFLIIFKAVSAGEILELLSRT